MNGYYHELTLRNAAGEALAPRIIGSAAQTIDEAANERAKIAAQFHPDQIVSIVTLGQAPR